MGRRRFLGMHLLTEAQTIAERIGDLHLAPPRQAFHARTGVGIIFGGQLLMKRINAVYPRKDSRPRCGVAIVFAQMQNQVGAADLEVERSTWFKAVLPVDLETKKIKIKLSGLVFGKDADDRDC